MSNSKSILSFKGIFVATAVYALMLNFTAGDFLTVNILMIRWIVSIIIALIFLFPTLFIISLTNKITVEAFVIAGIAVALILPLWSFIGMGELSSYFYNSGDVEIVKNGTYTPVGFDLKMGRFWRDALFGGISGYIYWRFIRPEDT